jgi:hypothetical protein
MERELLSRTLVFHHIEREETRENETCLRGTVKLRRARGGCLGVERRRRTWTAAKSLGELLTSVDPGISESGNRLWLYTGAHH